MNGIINVYKEAGYTSHDVVARLRGILGLKRIGHTGTLDPAAAGVLPVCVGRSTVLADLIADGEKTYEAVLLLGKETDTYDLEGRVLKESDVTCTEDEVRACIQNFIGEQDQVPPMYSAVKIGGKKLYELARAGITVERKPRRITIYDITVRDINLPEVTLAITCSKGTYIRSLVHDIGQSLGCGGCMAKLLRTKVGIFEIGDAQKIDEIREAADSGKLDEILKGPDSFFTELPKIRVNERAQKAAYNGNRIRIDDLIFETIPQGMVRLYDSCGGFIGLFEQDGGNAIKPYKMLYDA